MYDDLARTQNPTAVEWFVLHAVIPSVLVTAALHWSPAAPGPLEKPTYVLVCPSKMFESVIEPFVGGPIPDVFPVLVRMPRARYPEALLRARIEGRVVLRALVNTSGRVDSSSILVLRATHVEFLVPARQALKAALFRPGWLEAIDWTRGSRSRLISQCLGSDDMKAISSAVSISAHVALGAAVLFGTAKTGRSDPGRPRQVPIIFQPAVSTSDPSGGLSIPGPVSISPPVDLSSISVLSALQTAALMKTISPVYSGAVRNTAAGQPGGWGGLLTEEHAEVLTAPLPLYPDLLRQAGVQGRVVLEAVVDTTGRVLAQSISVVSATNTGFVAPARQALLATLFRPAMISGKPVRMLVLIPYEFAIRNGPGRAR